MRDHVDFVVAQWADVMPELDASSMEIFGRMIRVQKHLERLRSEALSQYGFKEGEFDVLATLRRSGSPYRLTPTELYRSLLITSGAMTNRLVRLESAGMIERIADSQDKRSSQVALTEKGKALIEQAVKTHTEVQNGVLDGLEPEQRQILAGLLKKILLNLSDEKVVAPS
ncbi:MarR family transcriptional regulator [Zymomonas mobilis subsp. mobilis ZM4 = ATCC 31821]|uniref:Transcriptional regulator, MarR family n=1 Tax=Zymomonas mobilis subsp. mobilis (strain ATCC 31821 / ZM4 / CP4) TaxID=264203 RepID=Q5NRH6_ZYMMO|nr:MarR family transcriptional regulator [Zymomonas mobilis]AAV88678.1 transcriptional regulator, MarR family [Zymomonas mobilis subsp. mobilis ZM4 = ATCC 31821]AVZ25091.1 MarR family transcriptional regulator [Zymomonas mobilis subsp. mobilis]AVZ26982.1 MarR family transcriptional regulator [Zymomonas mobilis subsp. mobilis]AVZ41428.1 MarR family transcriptional regulator [Zymomonas mobilis subsp. mobilis ZM4 = ATCC 31821]MCP9308491.1 MarR family transcriptional regulator [Zymomonas mobilis]